MSSVLYSINVGDTLEQVTITNPGPGIDVKDIEIQVDLGNDVTDTGAAASPRPIKRGEILTAIETLKQAILRDATNLID